MQLRLFFSLLFCGLLSTAFGQVSIGLIGTATPGGWDRDTNLVQVNDSLWSMTLDLKQGEAKFRQNDAWDINWGDSEFPIGKGTQGGSNIPVPADGNYTVTFNSKTGDYEFSIKSDIGILGSAAPKGWDADVNLFQDKVDTNEYTLTLRLKQGDVKFRQNDAWAVNWGSKDFPTGVGTQGGDNIPVAAAGRYKITFNKSTGAYKFEEILEFRSIGLIGSATPGGWDKDTDLTKDGGNPDLWKGTVGLIPGEAKFRANGGWVLNWGDTLFPIAIGIPNGPNIKIPTAGEYLVSFNTKTLEYKFLVIGNYETIGIIGSATPGGWDTDTDLQQDATDRSIWRGRLVLKDGEAKFRAGNAWDVNWGAGDFPTGIATQDGANIPVPAGEYKITFNSTTGDYNFEKLVVFSTIGLIGPATPVGNWDTDVNMNKSATDESFWEIPTITLKDGEAKFRAEDAWAKNWGAKDWPSGTGTQDGPNIPITAGTYRVTLNSVTGEYSFGPTSSTLDLLHSNSISIAPNPVKDVLNIRLENELLRGEVRFILFNAQGQQVMSQKMNMQELTTIPVGNIAPGHYTVHLSNGQYIVGKKVVIVK
jgi:hypothetical protein